MNHLPPPIIQQEFHNWCVEHQRLYSGIICPECSKNTPKEYIVESTRLTHIRQAINIYFQRPDIGMHALDQIVSHCITLAQVIDHLSNYDLDSIEYHMQRAKVIRMIQGNIEAYIDNKLEPQS